MAQRRIIESYGRDLGFTIDQSDIKDALKRARQVGCLIDELIDVLDFSICTWGKYMKLKTEYINSRLDLCSIEAEVEEEIRLQSGSN